MNSLQKLINFSLISFFLGPFSVHAQTKSSQFDSIEQRILEIEKKIQARKQNRAQPPENSTGLTDPVVPETPQPFIYKNTPLPEEENTPEIIEPTTTEPELIQSTSFDNYAEDDSSVDLPILEDKRNRLNFHLGFVIPTDCKTSNREYSFDSGVSFGLEYQRLFEDESYINAGISHKSFQASGSFNREFLGVPQKFSYSGDSSITSFYGTLGQKWSLTPSLNLLTQASAGFASSDYQIAIKYLTSNAHISEDDISFYFSLLLGLNIQLNDSWESSLYYEFDGRGEVGAFGYQYFHTFGVSAGFGFWT